MKKVSLPLLALALALLLVPAASATHAPRVRLALVPLPRSVIGSAARAFAVAHNSGVVSNAGAASSTPDGTAATFKKLGRLSGYVLEYGNAFTGGAGVTDVHTGIEQYKTSADAKRGLAFWQKEDSKLGALNQPGFAVTNAAVRVPAVGKKRFAYLTSYSASNIAPVAGLREQVLDGPYILDVIVTAGSASAAKALAPGLAKKLDARLRLALKGRLHGKPVKLPPKQEAAQPAGGPDLSALALQASDVVGPSTIDKGYIVDPAAISDYSVFMFPAGQFDLLDQEIEWYPSANEASSAPLARSRSSRSEVTSQYGSKRSASRTIQSSAVSAPVWTSATPSRSSSPESPPSNTTTGCACSRSAHARTSSTSSSREMFGHTERRTFSASTRTVSVAIARRPGRASAGRARGRAR